MENKKQQVRTDYKFLGGEDPENTISYKKASFEIENPTITTLTTTVNKINEKMNKSQKVKIMDNTNENINCDFSEKSLESYSLKEKIKSCFAKIKKTSNKLFCNKYIQAFYGSLLTFVWVYCYIISLEGCDKQQAECLKEQNHSTVIRTGKYIFASAMCFTLLAILTLFKYTLKLFFYTSIAIMLYLFYHFDTGADFAHHGSYNRVFFYLFVVILSFVFATIYVILTAFIKFPLRTLAILAFSVFLIYYKINNFIYTSCDYWDKGFKSSKLRNDIGYCKIYTPSNICFLKVTNNLFDITALRGLNCAKDRSLFEERNLLKNYLTGELQGAKRLGFPRTENWNFFPESTFAYFNKNVFKDMVDMDKKEVVDEAGKLAAAARNKLINDTEVYLDFSKENDFPEVVINLKKNETLIKEREEIAQKHKNETLFKNVIFIYLDALARNHFRRKLPKTFAWLERFYDNSRWEDEKENSSTNNNENEDIKQSEDIHDKYSSYQFFKYHSVDYYTFANMIPGYFGVHKWDEKGTYFLYDYKAAGYITGQSTNVCEREGWDLEMAFEPYLNYTNYDHEFNSFYCDPNFADPDSPYQVLKGAYSVIRKCMYGKDSGEFQIEYAKQFFSAYKNQNKIYRMIFSDAHEGTLEVVKYLDDMLHGFFEFLLSEGHLENSVLMVMSDHGISLPGPAYLLQAKDWYSEVFLPSLFFVVPKAHENFKEIDHNLKQNENKWVTSFDINSSLRSFANKTNSHIEYGQSLLMEVIDENYRSCGFYRMQAGYCLCNWQP